MRSEIRYQKDDANRGKHRYMSNLPTGTVTLLFTDIEGSTRLLQQLGDRYANVLEDCRQLIRTAIVRWNGHEVDTQGDSFFGGKSFLDRALMLREGVAASV